MTIPKTLFAFLALLLLQGPIFGAFGLSTATDSYTVDTDAGLVFKVRRTDNGSNTQSAGDIMSLVYNGIEYQDQSRGSQINSGFDYLYSGTSSVTVSAQVINTDFVRITVQAGDLTHYYMARNGFPHIYMATYFTTEPDIQNLVRYIVRIPENLLPNGPTPSDIRDTDFTVESGDIFGFSQSHPNATLRGHTRSKHYSNMRIKDWSHIGATGTNVGAWITRSNHEGDSGGPFYRSLLMQTGGDQEITYILNYGQAQTEPYRTSILNGPYTLIFNNGADPTPPDTSWVANMGLTGYVGDSGRGSASATAINNRDTDYDYTIGFANADAQYWTDADPANGSFTKTGILPGTYTMRVYKNEYVVHTDSVSVTAGANTDVGSINITADPSTTAPLWRIGNWDGTPNELLNGDKVTTMHPSDTRMSSWTPGDYIIGSSTPETGLPAYQWKDINGNQVIKFDLTAGQLVDSTIKVGITVAYSGGRPKISLNSWTFPSNPSPSTQPGTRTLTTGSYRGNNTTYSFFVPGSELVAGTNTLTVFPISGSGLSGFLSAGYSLDTIEMYQGAAQTLPLPAAPGSLTATSGSTSSNLTWSAASGATSHSIRRSTTPGGPYTTVASDISGTNFTDTGLTADTTYYYLVSGTNSSGSGLPSPEAAITTGSVEARYAFESNAQDDSGNGHHGTPANLSYVPYGSGNQAAQFNGSNSSVDIPRSVQDDFSVSLWVKTTDSGGTGTHWWSGNGLVDGEVAGAAADWGLTIVNGKAAFGIGGPDLTILSTTSINDGNWHHVAATRNNSTGAIALYIDGSHESSGTGPTGSRSAPPTLRIGSIRTGSGFLNGCLDAVHLHTKTLNPSEVSTLFLSGAQIPSAPTNLTASAVTGNRIDLSWTPAPTATSYSLRRATVSEGPYETIASGLTSPTFSDTGLNQGTTYYYVVNAANANGSGPDSAEASVLAIPPAPLLHLRFDESSGPTATDSSGNGWNANLLNGPTWTAGRINNAVNLDGTNDLLTLPNNVVAGVNDFTAASWVFWDGGGNWQRILDFGTGTDNYMFLSPNSGSNTTRFAIRTPGTAEQIIDGPVIPTGTWTHVAVTLSGNTGTLYINGAAVGTNAAITLTPANLGATNQNFIGDSQFSPDPGFDGAVDEFQLHNRAFSSAEIADLASPPSAPTGLSASAGNAAVTLQWNAVAGADGYHLKRSTNPGGPYTTIAAHLLDTAFSDTLLNNGTTYHYIVTAQTSVAESPASLEVTGTPVLPPTPFAHLRFDESSGLTASDSTGNGWNATLVNGPTWIPGQINNAVSLDGSNDHLTLPNSAVSTLNDFTIASWVKWNGGTLNWQRVFDFGTNTTNYMFLTPQNSFNGHVRFAIRSTASVTEQTIDGTAALPIGVWTHVAVSLSGTTGKLYVNGTEVGDNPAMTLTPSSLGNTTQNYLGRSQFIADPYFSGSLDEFQIHNRPLSAAEIAALASPPLAPSSLVATAGEAETSLTWNSVATAAGYLVKRSTTSGGPYAEISSELTTTHFTDTTVTNGTTYHYVVTAIASIAESPHSNESSATPLSPIQSWRLANFGTIDNTGTAADDFDADGDGWTNAEEFATGTDPNDPDSRLYVSDLTTSANNLLISFPTVSGRLYHLEWSATLATGSWTPVLTSGTPQVNIPGTGGIIQITDTNGALHDRRFYRVGVGSP